MKSKVLVKDNDSTPWLCSKRVWLALFSFMGFVFVYTQRVGMSIAIVCMVNHTDLAIQSQAPENILNTNHFNHSASNGHLENRPPNSSDVDICSAQLYNQDSQDGPFSWSKTLQGHILGAFFYGYLVSQVPAGLLAQRFGGKWVFAGFYLITTVATLLTPVAARMHYAYLIAIRVIVGIGSGAVFPIMHSIWAQWAPPYERSRLAGITYAGAMMGNVVAMPVSGVLCQHGFDGGWPAVFYVFGILSMVWLLLWTILVSDSPANCRHISIEEQAYILDSQQGQTTNQKNFSTPWLSFAKSPAVWAILIANFSGDWGLYTVLTNIPTYMYEVLRFDVQSNGVYSALPFVGLWLNMNLSPVIADKLRSSGMLTTGATRKLFNTIGHVGAAVFLVALAFVDCTRPMLAVGLLTCAITIFGSSYTGFLVNHMDIAPQFAGTLLGITNCLSAASGFIAPYVAAVLTTNQTREEWQTVFFISAVIYLIGAIFYVIFASGEIQPWADTLEMRNVDTETAAYNHSNQYENRRMTWNREDSDSGDDT